MITNAPNFCGRYLDHDAYSSDKVRDPLELPGLIRFAATNNLYDSLNALAFYFV
ncbi:MAG: hypothetical protein JWL59_3306 [Chthoniobacteraceae bacterium]|nr:hypothetical protein [Chthoniobacteraceae bacterium]